MCVCVLEKALEERGPSACALRETWGTEQVRELCARDEVPWDPARAEVGEAIPPHARQVMDKCDCVLPRAAAQPVPAGW